MVATVAMFSTVWAQSRRSSSQSASPSFPGLSTWNSGGSSSRDIPKSNLGAEGEGPRLWHEPAALPAHSLVRSVPAGLSPHLMASHKTSHLRTGNSTHGQEAVLVGGQHLKGHKKPSSAPQMSCWALAQVQPALSSINVHVDQENTEVRVGKSASSPELGQENLHHPHHVHVHVQREGGLGGSRGFNVVNLQESTSVRDTRGQALLPALAADGELRPARSRAPYHDATPAGAVEGIGGHRGSVLVLDVERGVGALRHVQQEVQHGVERGGAGS